MPVYALAVIPLMLMILEITNTKTNSDAKMVAYANDFSGTGSTSNLKYWRETLCELGPKLGYFPEPMVGCVNCNCSDKSVHVFEDANVQMITKGKRYLGAALGASQFRNEYIKEKILHVLIEIAKIEPQAAYTCFLSSYKHKLNYYMKTIPDITRLLKKVDEVILTKFIPVITGGITITENERKLLPLSSRLGGLCIPIFEEGRETEYQNSIMISEHLCNRITDQFRRQKPDPELNNKKSK